jgi:ferredoxin-NADP reductase
MNVRVESSVFEPLRVDLEVDDYTCGAVRLISDIALTLEQRGVSSSEIHPESFGPVAQGPTPSIPRVEREARRPTWRLLALTWPSS